MQVSRTEDNPQTSNLPCIWVRDFNFEQSQNFSREIFRLGADPSVEEIFVYISSYGGAVFSLLMMVDAMNACTKPVNTVVMGVGASCGSVLAVCGTGKRFIAPNAYLHIHPVSSGTFGDVYKMEVDVGRAKTLNSQLMSLIADKSKLTKTELLRKIKETEKEWMVNPKEALKYGFADLIGVPKFSQTTTISADF